MADEVTVGPWRVITGDGESAPDALLVAIMDAIYNAEGGVNLFEALGALEMAKQEIMQKIYDPDQCEE
jgi:hypothetical protein